MQNDKWRENFSGDAPWEAAYGYSRAVRVGNRIEIAGTVAAVADGRIYAPNDAYAQSVHIFGVFAEVLERAGAGLSDVVRTRAYITDLDQADGFGRAHGEAFENIRPACTMVQVSGLMGEGAVIEIEAIAVIPQSDARNL